MRHPHGVESEPYKGTPLLNAGTSVAAHIYPTIRLQGLHKPREIGSSRRGSFVKQLLHLRLVESMHEFRSRSRGWIAGRGVDMNLLDESMMRQGHQDLGLLQVYRIHRRPSTSHCLLP